MVEKLGIEVCLRRVMVVGLALAGSPSLGQPPVANVVLTKAEMRPLPNTTTVVGTVEPLTRSVIGSEIAGIVESMPVRQGDRVETGALILKLNDDSLRWQLAEAEAALAGALARVTQADFEVQRIRVLYDETQANEKEVYDVRADADIARFRAEEEKARVDRLATDLRKTEIKAPFTGFVIERRTEVGEWVDRGGSVVEMIDLSSVLVRVDVPEDAFAYIKQGAPCKVLVDALKRNFTGKVWRLIRQADANARTFPVEIVIENRDLALASGMFVRATLITGPERDVLSVPKDAIVERDGVCYVGVVFPGERGPMGVLTPVTTGADVGDWVAITAGNVRVGGDVVIRGNERGVYPFPSAVRVVDEWGNPVNSESRKPKAESRKPKTE